MEGCSLVGAGASGVTQGCHHASRIPAKTTTTIAPTLNLDFDDSAGAGGNDYAVTFTEGDAATAIADTDTDLADVDSSAFTNVTLAISGLLDANAEELVLEGVSFALATDNAGQDTATYTVAITTGAGTANVTITPGDGPPRGCVEPAMRRQPRPRAKSALPARIREPRDEASAEEQARPARQKH